MKEPTKEQIAFNVEMIVKIAGALPLDYLEGASEAYKNDVSMYDGLGILDGINYFQNSDLKKAYAARMKALYGFAKCLHDTNEVIKKGGAPSALDNLIKQQQK